VFASGELLTIAVSWSCSSWVKGVTRINMGDPFYLQGHGCEVRAM
jgi:hypothetical protein